MTPQRVSLITLGNGAMALAQSSLTNEKVGAAYAKALKVCATSLKTPENVFRGGYSGNCCAPDGHVWEMAMNPFSPFNSDGSFMMSP
jgi:uncharacterized glyoxalase superfamily protein PhnB